MFQEWGGLNLFDLATIIDAKNFISHAAYQSYLTDIWMGQIKPSTSAFKVRSNRHILPFAGQVV